ncbi:putative protein TPRXL [Schistocerca piceifrons]|uniref:putative protein TPRXL n=1 Tax=Schistocerca piceifrons TaxID=274613 RepID=UPI001F5FC4D7|nr:putative protein TPRXL [Schistocerca piceifrons]
MKQELDEIETNIRKNNSRYFFGKFKKSVIGYKRRELFIRDKNGELARSSSSSSSSSSPPPPEKRSSSSSSSSSSPPPPEKRSSSPPPPEKRSSSSSSSSPPPPEKRSSSQASIGDTFRTPASEVRRSKMDPAREGLQVQPTIPVPPRTSKK